MNRPSLLRHQLRDSFGRREIDRFNPRLAVNSESQLRLSCLQPHMRFLTRNRTGSRRDAEALDRACDTGGDGGHRLEIRPRFGGASGDLMNEERACDAARLGEILKRNVVGDDDHLDLQSSRARALGGETKIEPVARVVLDDQQAPVLAGHRQNRRVHCIDGRRSEDLSAHGGRQRAPADKPRMRRLVPRASSRNERHLAAVPVGANDNLHIWKAIKPRQPRRRRDEKTVDRLGHDRVSLIHEMSHAAAPRPPTRSFGRARPVWAPATIRSTAAATSDLRIKEIPDMARLSLC